MKKLILLVFGALLAFSADLYAQARHITGRVLDETDEGLPGAGITVWGTSTGTVTDVEGNFVLDLTWPELRNLSSGT
jgi:hypothetical protein